YDYRHSPLFHYSHNPYSYFLFFFFTATAPTELYTLSLHDALPICSCSVKRSSSLSGPVRLSDAIRSAPVKPRPASMVTTSRSIRDRKSTRLNSSHLGISYAVFCLKKKKQKNKKKNYKEKNYEQITI